MEEDPSTGTGERPKILNNVTGWIGGLTAIVIALAGLKAAYNQLNPSAPAEAADAQQAASTGPAEDASAAVDDQAAAADLPTKYTGTWENKDVTLEWRNGIWVETTAGGTDDEIVTNYEQLSRNETMTNAVDRDRKLYVRWPTDGGTLEESEDGNTWTRSYEVTAA